MQKIYPLTSQQKGLWFEYNLNPSKSNYNCFLQHEIQGNLDEERFMQGLYALMKAFDPFRTSFMEKNNEIFQVIQDSPNNEVLIEKDLSNLKLSEKARAEHAKKFLMEECLKPYDLIHSPPIRLIFIKVSPQLFYFGLASHHIIIDALSATVSYYPFISASYNNTLDLSLSYRGMEEYWEVLHKEEIYSDKEKQKSIKYWEKELKGRDLEIVFPRNQLLSDDVIEVGKFPFTLNEKIVRNIKDFCRKNKITPFIFLSACFGSLIYRYWDAQDFTIGYPVDMRPKGFQNSPGFYVSLFPWRFNFENNITFDEIIGHMKHQRQSDKNYQDIVFPDLIHSLRTDKKGSNFNFNTIISSTIFDIDLLLVGLKVTCLHVNPGAPFTDLSLAVDFTSSNFKSLFEYNSSLFSMNFIKVFSLNFKNFVNLVFKKPHKKINEIDILTNTEKQKILINWNDTKKDYSSAKTIHQLFEEQFSKTPKNIAVIFEGQHLTYEQLNSRANQLAHYLREQGVKPDALVAIAAERSLEIVIGILGILKAGGAYVPIDPSYPQERIQFMLEDTKASLLLTQEATLKRLPTTVAKVFLLDEDRGLLESYSTTNPSHITQPHHLAYAIYTSGSTGQPKGVMIEHQSICNRLLWWQDYAPLSCDDRFLHQFSFSFDGAVVSLWWPLLNSATVIIPIQKSLNDLEYLCNILSNNNVTCLLGTPSLIGILLGSLKIQKVSSIRKIMLAGEVFSKEVYDRLLRWKGISIYNFYGPTETSIIATSYDATGKDIITSSVPIGSPVANTKVYILDRSLKPVPIGGIGELYIGGEGLARGYLNRPGLTAERFIQNPFQTEAEKAQEKHGRLYKTGDLSRWLEDGNIEYLGRCDDQVKIRGFRIELGEIESVFLKHPQVKEAVVIARGDVPGDKRLVGYIVYREQTEDSDKKANQRESGIEFSDLRTYLQTMLPDYMIPTAFVKLECIPLTPNGKIDRKGLPSPEYQRDEKTFVAPRTEVEKALCAIWQAVLKVEKLGIYDNFFELGGDSIISIQLVSKARQKGLYINAKDIFNHPTIAELASISQTEKGTLRIKPEQGMVKGKVALTPIQHWFFEQNFLDKHHFNQAILLEAKQKIDCYLLNKAFNLLMEHHDALRLHYSQNKQGWQQEYAQFQEEEICEAIDLSREEDLSKAIERENIRLQQNLNIETGPIIKAGLFECGKGRNQRLIIVIHHLAVDGVSWRILVEDLERVYSQLCRGDKPSLLPKTHSYQQWAKALTEYASSEDLLKEIPYWEKVQKQIIPLPTDFSMEEDELNYSIIAVFLSTKETNALLTQVPKAYRTQINDVLLTALVLAVGERGKYELSLQLEGHGRQDIIQDMDLSRTVGWFTSIFPIHLKIENHQDIAESIKSIKETLREIPHKGVGYGILKYLTDKLTKAPSPSLGFNYLGQWDNTLVKESFFTFGQESIGQSISLRNKLPLLISIDSEVKEGALQVYWTYSNSHYRKQTIQELANSFKRRVQQIIEHCSQTDNFGYTPSDFPLSALDQNSLDRNFGKLASIEEIYPLSPMQSGLLFQALYRPESDAYFVQTVLELEGEVDTRTLQSAWQEVSNVHPILRTGLAWKELEVPLQYVLESVKVPFEVKSWEKLEEEEQKQNLNIFIQEDRARGFDLSQAPLLRLTLIQCKKTKYFLIWSQHHTISDGWSLPIILGDLFKVYLAVREGRNVNLSIRRPYRDYIAWLQKQDIGEAEKFWKGYLNHLEGPTRLSFKGSVSKGKEKDYETYAITLPHNETKTLQKFAQDHGLTLNTIIQGAIGFVLKTYIQVEDILLGITVSGRNIDLSNIEEMVGPFINTLPLRMDVNGERDILSFLKNLQTQAQRINEYTYSSLAQIQSWAGMNERMFDVIYVFENYPLDEEANPSSLGFSIRNIQGIEKTEYPLSIMGYLREDLHLKLSYETDHCDEKTIKSVAEHIKITLRGFVENPSCLIKDFSFLTEREKQQILIGWNETKKDYQKDKTIHQLFEEQVTRTPTNIAVIFDGQCLTYEQLNRKANQLAHYLRKREVTPNTLVAIAAERSLEMVVGILGILKAGGAYVPIDPAYPKERIQFMLEDTKAVMLLTQQEVVEELPNLEIELFFLDKQEEKLSTYSETNLPCIAQPYNLAYVIYTSGSTGWPKGVVIEHRSLSNLVMGETHFCKIDQYSKILMVASLGFDAAGWDIYGALSNGATLFIANDAVRALGDELHLFVRKNHITIATMTPALIESFPFEPLPDLKMLIIMGDKPNEKIMSFWSEHTCVVNGYGPTETTIAATLNIYQTGHLSSCIGRPLPNYCAFILDKYKNPVPIGVPGELYIGGEGIAKGYLNQPELTMEKFILNPFQTKKEKIQGKNSRLYKTGDLCRWLEDGNIEYLGRLDHQIKIRGIRIEPGEIEAAILKYTPVKEALVIAREDTPGDKRLVGYVVLKKSEPEYSDKKSEAYGALELREHLQAILPNHMIPSVIVTLEALPLTVNGKVDRKGLPAPNYQMDNQFYVAPRTEIEKELCKIWQAVLKVEKVSIYDNFFEVGGNSLSLVHLASRIQTIFLKTISIKDLYSSPTVAEQASYINSDIKNFFEQHILSFRTKGSQAPLFLFHPGEGLSFCYGSLTEYLKDLPFYGINHPALIDHSISFSTLEDLATHYIGIMKAVQSEGPYRFGGWSFGGLIAYEIARQLLEQGEEVEKVFLIDAYHPEVLKTSEKIYVGNNMEQMFEGLLAKQGLSPASSMGATVKSIFTNNIELALQYSPKPYSGSVALLKGLPDLVDFDIPLNGWNQFAIPRLEVSFLKAKHDAFFDLRYVPQVAKWIKKHLRQENRKYRVPSQKYIF